jgi:hypothetical protein
MALCASSGFRDMMIAVHKNAAITSSGACADSAVIGYLERITNRRHLALRRLWERGSGLIPR